MFFFRGQSESCEFRWEGQTLQVVDEFKYSGIMSTSNRRMTQAAERMQLPFPIALAKVQTLIKKEGVADHAFAYVWLFQIMVLSASLYGCVLGLVNSIFAEGWANCAQSKSCFVLQADSKPARNS